MRLWGVSSDASISSTEFLARVIERTGVGRVFLPTLRRKLAREDRVKARLFVAQLSERGYVIVERPFWASVDVVKNLAKELGDLDAQLIPSLYAASVRDVEQLMTDLGDDYGVIELDFTVSPRTSFTQSLALELAREIHEVFGLKMYVKMSVFHVDAPYLLSVLSRKHIEGLILAPHVVYFSNGEFYRVHSTFLSSIGLKMLESFRGFTSSGRIGYVYEGFNIDQSVFLPLMGVSLVIEPLLRRGVTKDGRIDDLSCWEEFPEGAGIIVKGCKANTCPFGCLENEGEYLVSNDECDLCGLCISLATHYKVYKDLRPS